MSVRPMPEQVMSIAEVLPNVQALSRQDQLRLIEIVAKDLATTEEAMGILPNRDYPVWSPLGAHEAAATLLKVLDQEKSVTQ
jgi:hypothetical protein